ncbi:MAG: 5-oxoprolinase subunit PxpB [Chitinophagaceae bacterium]|nr:5-oxoprolinase subunit PxpB [Chitinophagaceae bacterium]
MPSFFPYRFCPLGDSAVVAVFGDTIEDALNRHVIALCKKMQDLSPAFVTDLLPAYSSLTVFYDIHVVQQIKPGYISGYDYVCHYLENIFKQGVDTAVTEEETVVRIPVCYEDEFAPDMQELAKIKQLSTNEIVQLHSAKKYRVYMIGFLPGFAYMGKVEEAIAVPRKKLPQPVRAGSVGIAGEQTGIYPLSSPGGWHIIGRTPVKLFNTTGNDPVLLKAGNIVQFYPISRYEYKHY